MVTTHPPAYYFEGYVRLPMGISSYVTGTRREMEIGYNRLLQKIFLTWINDLIILMTAFLNFDAVQEKRGWEWNIFKNLWRYFRRFLSVKDIFSKWANTGLFLFIFILFRHKFYRKNCRLQGYSNSDRPSRRQARWPLDHRGGPVFLTRRD